jgi:sugar lactone lactonase YvrE
MASRAGEVEVLSSGHGLLEGPVWHPKYGLLVADAIVGGVLSLKPGQEPATVVAHRRGIGGMALHADGGIVISGRNVAIKRPLEEADDSTAVLLESDASRDIVGYNDLTVDPAGRIYVGSLAFVAATTREGKPGDLYVVDLDGTSRIVARDVMLTNGLGFSPDGRTIYHSDSLRPAVYAYDVQENGDVGSRRTFIVPERGQPDGLAVDEQGTVWVAMAGAGEVVGYSPDGALAGRIPIPVPMVTSLCFGGEGLDDLYIVSGSEGLSSDRGGGVYRIKVDVPGLPRPVARVAYKKAV